MAEAVQREAMQQPAGENERAVQREATRQPDGASKGDGMLRGCGAMRSHTTTDQVSGRQRRSRGGGVGEGVGRTGATVE